MRRQLRSVRKMAANLARRARNRAMGAIAAIASSVHPGPELPSGIPPVRAGRRAWPRRRFSDFTGFHDQSASEREQGMAWMSQAAAVRLFPSPHEREVRIQGTVSLENHERAHPSSALHLRVDVDGRRVCDRVFSQSQPFEVILRLPSGHGHNRILGLTCNQTFVPSALGLNVDRRALSLQVARITVDGFAVVDFGRPHGAYESPPEEEPGVALVGSLALDIGLGQAARLCVAACEAAGIHHRAWDVSEVAIDPTRAPLASAAFGEHPVTLVVLNADQFPYLHTEIDRRLFRDRYVITHCAWELEELPDALLAGFDYTDEVWVPSRFIWESLAAKAPVPMLHMPYGVEFSPSPDVRREDLGLPADAFLFLVMYDMRSHQARKNPEGAIEAFARAFPSSREVRLVVKVSNGAFSPSDLQRLQERLAQIPGAILIDRNLSRQAVHDLQALCDSYVSLHRAEGWGLNLSECMFLGKPVVGTNWSGNLDFMSSTNSCLVDCSLVPIERDHGPYPKGARWAEPDLDHAAWFMKRIVEDQPWRQILGQEAQRSMKAGFSHRAAGERFRRRLQVIGRRLL